LIADDAAAEFELNDEGRPLAPFVRSVS